MRYEVKIETTMTYVMAVEAPDVFEAQTKALAELPDPMKVETRMEFEVGNG